MTRDDIIFLPNKHLRQRSRRVGLISGEIKQLISDMEAATLDWEDHRDHEVGVALAAIQIDQPYRVIIVRNNFDDKTDRSFSAFINPEIVKNEGDLIKDFEGCLSVKDIYGEVARYERVKVKALNEHGQEVRVTATGFLARVFQHEIDHTHGTLFVDHIKDKPEAFYRLDKDGKLKKLNYERDVKSTLDLWQ